MTRTIASACVSTAACAGSPDRPRAHRPVPPPPPTANASAEQDAGATEDAEVELVFPPAPTDFPVTELMARRLQYLRADPIDPQWPEHARAALA